MFGLLGNISNPTKYSSTNNEGLFTFISNIFQFAGVIAGIVFIIRIILAGYSYLSTSGDPKKFQQASDTIFQSILGLLIISSAFIITGLLGRFTQIDILNPTIYGP